MKQLPNNDMIALTFRLLSSETPFLVMVGLDRIELSTSRLSGVRSNHLSYRPIPLTPALSQREKGKCMLRRSCVEEATLAIMVSILWSKAP